MKWNNCTDREAPEGVRLKTKIDDAAGERNHAILKRQGNLWFLDDGMYVYYRPTHWAMLGPDDAESLQDREKAALGWLFSSKADAYTCRDAREHISKTWGQDVAESLTKMGGL